jgi:hypothetical protein
MKRNGAILETVRAKAVVSVLTVLVLFGRVHGQITVTCTPSRVDTSNKFPCPVTVTYSFNALATGGAQITTATMGNATVNPAGPVAGSGTTGTFVFDAGCGAGVGGGTVTFTATRTAAGHTNESASCTVDVVCVTPVAEANNKKILKGSSTTVTVTLKGMKCVTGREVQATVQPATPNKVSIEGLDANHVSTLNTRAPVLDGKAHFRVTCASGNWGSSTHDIDFSVVGDPGNSYDKTISVTCNPPAQNCGQSPNGCQSVHPGPGCNDISCCDLVCDVNPLCCLETWAPECVGLAQSVCPATTCGDAPGNCCSENPTPSCSDAACCSAVCAQDPWCCGNQWDQLCADTAAGLCDSCAVAEAPTVSGLGLLVMGATLLGLGAAFLSRARSPSGLIGP